MRFGIFVILVLTTIMPAYSRHLYLEKDYQNVWCSSNHGTSEYRLYDGTRVDCVTKTHAIEFDFANKWAESIGQSLYYSKNLSKKAGVVLIMENPQKDLRYLKRLKQVANSYNITVWTITPDDMKKYVLINNKK